mmetsp:Transcript_18612/g.47158  ORF Transcript_18612/g.47158 Transcript_18612/m.47158 type:complete len:443 (-) Transcript_18612:854-2182(-)
MCLSYRTRPAGATPATTIVNTQSRATMDRAHQLECMRHKQQPPPQQQQQQTPERRRRLRHGQRARPHDLVHGARDAVAPVHEQHVAHVVQDAHVGVQLGRPALQHQRRHHHRRHRGLERHLVLAQRLNHALDDGRRVLGDVVGVQLVKHVAHLGDERVGVRARVALAHVEDGAPQALPVLPRQRAEKVEQVGAVHVAQLRDHAHVKQDELRRELHAQRARQPAAPAAQPRSVHLLHQDVARVHVRVDEVVAQQHLQVAVQPRLGQRVAVLVLRLVDKGGDEVAVLKRLHQHVLADQREQRRGERDVGPHAEVLLEAHQVVRLHRQVQLLLERAAKLADRLVQAQVAQRGQRGGRARRALHELKVAVHGGGDAGVAHLDRHHRAGRHAAHVRRARGRQPRAVDLRDAAAGHRLVVKLVKQQLQRALERGRHRGARRGRAVRRR